MAVAIAIAADDTGAAGGHKGVRTSRWGVVIKERVIKWSKWS
jgi:hypothetical protein